VNGRDPGRRGNLFEYFLGGAVTFLLEASVVLILAVVAVTLSSIILALT
jgi:hypothetical protein